VPARLAARLASLLRDLDCSDLPCKSPVQCALGRSCARCLAVHRQSRQLGRQSMGTRSSRSRRGADATPDPRSSPFDTASDSCQGLRTLGLRDPPRHASRRAKGPPRVESSHSHNRLLRRDRRGPGRTVSASARRDVRQRRHPPAARRPRHSTRMRARPSAQTCHLSRNLPLLLGTGGLAVWLPRVLMRTASGRRLVRWVSQSSRLVS